MRGAPASAGRVQSINPFGSFFLAGFECSSHRLSNGRRLDVVSATGHDLRAAADYRQLARHGVATVRDGLRWHLIDRGGRAADWSSFLPMLRAARETGTQVVWDLAHYGWPDDLDIWSPAFVDRFAAFAGGAARLVREETDAVPFYCPVNEISFWSWAGGDVGYLNPHERNRAPELKRQLVRAAIAAIAAIRAVDPRARFLHAEPAIHIAPRIARPDDVPLVRQFLLGQWEALDMLSGALAPELGGRPENLDMIGLNYYPNNQWVHESGAIPLGRFDYRPFREILAEAFARYGRPLVVAETGAEGSAGAAWLHYIAGEVQAAMASGVPVQGICLYPILDYPGWDNDRDCPVGLLKMAIDNNGDRLVDQALATELDRQRALLSRGRQAGQRQALLGQRKRR